MYPKVPILINVQVGNCHKINKLSYPNKTVNVEFCKKNTTHIETVQAGNCRKILIKMHTLIRAYTLYFFLIKINKCTARLLGTLA